jgi:hypothetical protein
MKFIPEDVKYDPVVSQTAGCKKTYSVEKSPQFIHSAAPTRAHFENGHNIPKYFPAVHLFACGMTDNLTISQLRLVVCICWPKKKKTR